jgi:hypothetical protein
MLRIATLKANWRILLGSLIVTLLCLEVVVLTLQNRMMKEILRSTTPLGQFEILHPGDQVPPIKLQSLEGSTVELKYDGSNIEHNSTS